jgi:hypothetical protein
MAPSDQVILKEIVAMRGDLAKMSDLMQAMIQEARETSRYLAGRLERMKSKT